MAIPSDLEISLMLCPQKSLDRQGWITQYIPLLSSVWIQIRYTNNIQTSNLSTLISTLQKNTGIYAHAWFDDMPVHKVPTQTFFHVSQKIFFSVSQKILWLIQLWDHTAQCIAMAYLCKTQSSLEMIYDWSRSSFVTILSNCLFVPPLSNHNILLKNLP